jgi:hypothetical protein
MERQANGRRSPSRTQLGLVGPAVPAVNRGII